MNWILNNSFLKKCLNLGITSDMSYEDSLRQRYFTFIILWSYFICIPLIIHHGIQGDWIEAISIFLFTIFFSLMWWGTTIYNKNKIYLLYLFLIIANVIFIASSVGIANRNHLFYFSALGLSKVLLKSDERYKRWTIMALTLLGIIFANILPGIPGDMSSEGYKIWSTGLINDVSLWMSISIQFLFFELISKNLIEHSKHEFQKRLEAEAEISRMNRMVHLSSLTAGLAHEINNPLTIVKMSLARAKHQNEISEDTYDVIFAAVGRIQHLIQKLRSVPDENKEVHLVRVNVCQMVRDCFFFFDERLRQMNLKVDTSSLDSELYAEVDPLYFEQIVINLMENAYYEIRKQEKPWLKISSEDKIDHLGRKKIHMSFENSGDPIPFDIQEKIMAPFFTTKKIGVGTGLGLYLSSQYAKSIGGELAYIPDAKHPKFGLALPAVE